MGRINSYFFREKLYDLDFISRETHKNISSNYF